MTRCPVYRGPCGGPLRGAAGIAGRGRGVLPKRHPSARSSGAAILQAIDEMLFSTRRVILRPHGASPWSTSPTPVLDGSPTGCELAAGLAMLIKVTSGATR